MIEVRLVGAVGGESGGVWAGMGEVSCSSFSSGLAKEEANQKGENKKGRRAEVESRRAHCYHDQPFPFGLSAAAFNGFFMPLN